jgi:histidinol-phosphate/aromatic aminotransferase/cobyric acid decarboxylase-like protein
MTATAYERLLRSSVVGVGPDVPGASATETKELLGRDDVIRLNWNENLFGPRPGVLEATADRLEDAWTYPEEAYEELRHYAQACTVSDVMDLVAAKLAALSAR